MGWLTTSSKNQALTVLGDDFPLAPKNCLSTPLPLGKKRGQRHISQFGQRVSCCVWSRVRSPVHAMQHGRIESLISDSGSTSGAGMPRRELGNQNWYGDQTTNKTKQQHIYNLLIS